MELRRGGGPGLVSHSPPSPPPPFPRWQTQAEGWSEEEPGEEERAGGRGGLRGGYTVVLVIDLVHPFPVQIASHLINDQTLKMGHMAGGII